MKVGHHRRLSFTSCPRRAAFPTLQADTPPLQRSHQVTCRADEEPRMPASLVLLLEDAEASSGRNRGHTTLCRWSVQLSSGRSTSVTVRLKSYR